MLNVHLRLVRNVCQDQLNLLEPAELRKSLISDVYGMRGYGMHVNAGEHSGSDIIAIPKTPT